MKFVWAMLLAITLSGCEKIPDKCEAFCKAGHGAKMWRASPSRYVIRCADDAFFAEDSPDKCAAHGGLSRRQKLEPELSCHCWDGSFKRFSEDTL